MPKDGDGLGGHGANGPWIHVRPPLFTTMRAATVASDGVVLSCRQIVLGTNGGWNCESDVIGTVYGPEMFAINPMSPVNGFVPLAMSA
jgi:hypothetical protein